MELYFHGFWRMDWGFGNPNQTAALIVTIMFAVWTLAFLWRKGFWIGLWLFCGLGILLVHTFSRGGIAAFALGVAALLYFAPRPWPNTRIIGGVACVWIMFGASVFLQANQRFTQGFQDRSIANRLDIWKEIPVMIADAPGGWGIGNAARVYENWYQPLDRKESYVNLVSTHFTWLVEFSWWQRICYCFGWFMVGLLCWPPKERDRLRWFVVPLSIWVSFFVTAIFSHVAESAWLWMLPAAAFLSVLVVRWRAGLWPRVLAWSSALVASIVVVTAVTIEGIRADALHVHGSPHLVKVGNGEPRIWVVRNVGIMGEHYGKALRRFMENHPLVFPVALVDSVHDVPQDYRGLLVVCGDLPDLDRKLLHSEGRLLLLNPSFFPREAGVTSGQVTSVLFGEFSQSPSIQAWQSVGHVKTLEGIGDFVGSWPMLVVTDEVASISQ
jgi:hypothetical protein